MKDEILAAINRVIESGQFILGEEVKAFEEEFATYCGLSHATGVANGTEAIYIALKALNIGRGDEVITVSHTASATICAIKMAQATPIFIDIEEDTLLMNMDLIKDAITEKTKIILPVHLYGRPCDILTIYKIANTFGLRIIEDRCQAVGAGPQLGDFGCYSFYPTKNLGGMGDGGCIISFNEELDIKIKRLREYGYGERFVSNFFGINSRLDEIQAAILRVKLKYLNQELIRRQKLAQFYDNELKNTYLILPSWNPYHTYHQYVVRMPIPFTQKRDDLVKLLGAQIHYPVPCHLQPAYRNGQRLPITEKICKEILSLPMRISIEEAKEVCDKIKKFL